MKHMWVKCARAFEVFWLVDCSVPNVFHKDGPWPRPAIGSPLGIPVDSCDVYWVQTRYFPKQLDPSIVTWLQASKMCKLIVFYDESSYDGWWRYATLPDVDENTRRNLSLISSYAPTLHFSVEMFSCYGWMESFCFYLLEDIKTSGWHFHAKAISVGSMVEMNPFHLIPRHFS